MLYTIVKKCSDFDEDTDGNNDINLNALMQEDTNKLSKIQQKQKKMMLIKGKI